MYKAIKSFVGIISMNIGDTKAYIDENIAKDLIDSGYIIEEVDDIEKSEVKKEVKKKTSKKKK